MVPISLTDTWVQLRRLREDLREIESARARGLIDGDRRLRESVRLKIKISQLEKALTELADLEGLDCRLIELRRPQSFLITVPTRPDDPEYVDWQLVAGRLECTGGIWTIYTISDDVFDRHADRRDLLSRYLADLNLRGFPGTWFPSTHA